MICVVEPPATPRIYARAKARARTKAVRSGICEIGGIVEEGYLNLNSRGPISSPLERSLERSL